MNLFKVTHFYQASAESQCFHWTTEIRGATAGQQFTCGRHSEFGNFLNFRATKRGSEVVRWSTQCEIERWALPLRPPRMWGGLGLCFVYCVSTTLPRLMANILQQLKAFMACLYVFQHTDSVGCDMRPRHIAHIYVCYGHDQWKHVEACPRIQGYRTYVYILAISDYDADKVSSFMPFQRDLGLLFAFCLACKMIVSSTCQGWALHFGHLRTWFEMGIPTVAGVFFELLDLYGQDSPSMELLDLIGKLKKSRPLFDIPQGRLA